MFLALSTMLNDKNWMYIILRLFIIAVFSIFLYFTFPRIVSDLNSLRDIVIPASVGVGTSILVAVFTLIKPIKKYIPFVIMPADWALIAAYIYFFPNGDLQMLAGITIIISISGIMHVGSLFGGIELVGSLIAAAIAFASRSDVAFEAIPNEIELYIPTIFFTVIILFVVLAWHSTLDEENNLKRRSVRREIEESRRRLEGMRDRTNSIAEMATRLNSTLNYNRILDAALDIGRMSVRDSANSRLTSMALMVANDDGSMTIENSRGLQHTDENQTFRGEKGIIAQCMDKGEPIIHNGGSEDPELGVLTAFAHVKSTLVIPLRASYETYGVLVFGSTARNAINEDHIDTLSAIGVQATVALQNAVLYNNLRDEKERILRIEENGRKALVRDLHDIPTQTVSAVAMHLSTIPIIAERYPERLNDEITNIREMTLRATEEIRHVMFTLRPLSLEASGLSVALEQLAEKMGKTYKQPMQVKIDKRIEGVLEKDEQGTLFYLVEEAANNARKYAKASVIKVLGVLRENEVIIKIADNGKGFDVDAVGSNYENRGSFGMVNMRERAELINGSLSIKSAINKGTTITVRVPLEDENYSEKVPLLKPRKPLRKQYAGPMSPTA